MSQDSPPQQGAHVCCWGCLLPGASQVGFVVVFLWQGLRLGSCLEQVALNKPEAEPKGPRLGFAQGLEEKKKYKTNFPFTVY